MTLRFASAVGMPNPHISPASHSRPLAIICTSNIQQKKIVLNILQQKYIYIYIFPHSFLSRTLSAWQMQLILWLHNHLHVKELRIEKIFETTTEEVTQTEKWDELRQQWLYCYQESTVTAHLLCLCLEYTVGTAMNSMWSCLLGQ